MSISPSSFYGQLSNLVDKFISLLQVLPKEMRIMGESKILSFSVPGVD